MTATDSRPRADGCPSKDAFFLTFFLKFFLFEHYREHYREHPPRRVLLKTERKPATTKEVVVSA